MSIRNWEEAVKWRRWALPMVCLLIGLFVFAGLPGLGHMNGGLVAQAAGNAQEKTVFKDIQGHWAQQEIETMVKQGILDGYPDGTFRPNEPVKVDQFVKMLILSYSEQHPNLERTWKGGFLEVLSEENRTILKQDYRYFNFKPAMTGYWAKPYIDVASDLNFLNKSRYSDFQAAMTRENVAEVIYYTLQETEFLEDAEFSRTVAASYGDLTSATDRQQKFIAEALIKGIMEGYPDGNFGVGKTVSRAESLVLLSRLTDKAERLPIQAQADKLQRQVPTVGGGQRIVAFPDQQMWDAYNTLQKAGKLRGTNYDLFDTTLRLYRDEKEKKAVQQATNVGATGGATEEAAIWLDPTYNTYGITVRLREGALARNKESIELFANELFTYDAIAFHRWFQSICTEVEAGRPLADKQAIVGDYTVNVLVDNDAQTVVFSIAVTQP
ncbi:S-layer homology domain-containing protein [Paenibacillus senegalimassiliensis]|uniref:S-layer homology domain-containing protein n=1 Tax=Paenibacillus senegalimassiliensis TaxID=1737426 RepID=UPI00073E6217|nr:S-layer homology domain-containing protein [Paenibacillus senegalimassiliensis]